VTARDPRIDPQPGDLLRDPDEDFPRKIIKREPDRVLVEIGSKNRRHWAKLATWRNWASLERVVPVEPNQDE
jgi:hypothetical protein